MKVEVDRDWLVEVDSFTSLVAYRYPKHLPDGVVEALKRRRRWSARRTSAAASTPRPRSRSRRGAARPVVRDRHAAQSVGESTATRAGEGAPRTTGVVHAAGSPRTSKKNTPTSSPLQAARGGA